MCVRRKPFFVLYCLFRRRCVLSFHVGYFYRMVYPYLLYVLDTHPYHGILLPMISCVCTSSIRTLLYYVCSKMVVFILYTFLRVVIYCCQRRVASKYIVAISTCASIFVRSFAFFLLSPILQQILFSFSFSFIITHDISSNTCSVICNVGRAFCQYQLS